MRRPSSAQVMVREATGLKFLPEFHLSNDRTALKPDEKASYINATLCLQNAPAKGQIKGAQTRWDELQYAHIVQADYIHGTV